MMIRRWFRCEECEVWSQDPRCWCCNRLGKPCPAPMLRDQTGVTAIRVPAYR